ncbi:hypothetical protein nbrc107696_12260 [Gordonia spumicola]|uniref:Uncharacterized protein n=1 Tax=Gordonia spumicola TaxID=589161 RepID=A0A7I9V6T3_9ACTN|nr:hypothetical protein [Gordonia spumicola]GEE00744.1 hypothetical protein nbrc107696_11900 [Gordonia spumicola]GEE00780.1 hypothetical protein nbrc107696_12260 [Gordonia spumicola]
MSQQLPNPRNGQYSTQQNYGPPHYPQQPNPRQRRSQTPFTIGIVCALVLALATVLVIGNKQGIRELIDSKDRSSPGQESVYQQWLDVSRNCYDNCPQIDGGADREYADRLNSIYSNYDLHAAYNYPPANGKIRPNGLVTVCYSINPQDSTETASANITKEKADRAHTYAQLPNNNPYKLKELPSELATKVGGEVIDAVVDVYCPEFHNDDPKLGGWAYLSDIGR